MSGKEIISMCSFIAGVVAARKIARDELVEVAHCIFIPREEYEMHMRQVISSLMHISALQPCRSATGQAWIASSILLSADQKSMLHLSTCALLPAGSLFWSTISFVARAITSWPWAWDHCSITPPDRAWTSEYNMSSRLSTTSRHVT